MINELCEHNDIVVLQETWILPFDANLLDYVNSQFRFYSISAVDTGKLLVGRPFGNVCVLWKKDLRNCFDLLTSKDLRILASTLSFVSWYILYLNVYLPYYSIDKWTSN